MFTFVLPIGRAYRHITQRFQIKDTTKVMILPFVNIGYKRLSENKRFPNHRWYSNATWGEILDLKTLRNMTVGTAYREDGSEHNRF
jgi:hypothetical protein